MNTRQEKKYREFKKLRKAGALIAEASKAIGVSRTTGCKYEKRRENEALPKIIAATEKKYFDALGSEKTTPNDISKMADALCKLYSAYKKCD